MARAGIQFTRFGTAVAIVAISLATFTDLCTDQARAQNQPAAALDPNNPPPVDCVVLTTPDGIAGNGNGTPWPGGVVYYAFNANVSALNQQLARDAMDEIECKANITFVPRTNQPNYIYIQTSSGNNSFVGMIGGQQVVNIFNFNVKFIMVHEFMHALGFQHEHQRNDRNTYLTINFGNVCQTCCGGSCNGNFDLVPAGALIGSYDFDSVMHYGRDAFSINGQDTIVVKPPNTAWQNLIGQRTHLSTGDIAQLREFYGRSLCEPVFSMNQALAGANAGDLYANAVAIIRDLDSDSVPDLIIGSPGNDENGSNAGKVYVLSGADGSELWSKLGENPGDRFGFSVAACGDHVIVGAPYASSQAGKVYIYDVDGNAIRTRSGQRAGDRYGWSLAGNGDANDDGSPDLLVGAPMYNVTTTKKKAGAVYLYRGDTFAVLTKFKGAAADDRFGQAVGFVPRTGPDSIVIGAPNNDAKAKNAGRAYLYNGATYALIMTKNGSRAGDNFGSAVAGGLRTQGFSPYFVVGAPAYDNGTKLNAGRVYAYSATTGAQFWAKNGTAADDRLGQALANVGDADDDGSDDIAGGAPRNDGAASDAGAVCVISGSDGATLLTIQGDQANDLFGWAIAGRGIADGDDRCRMLVGAGYADSPALDAGKAYLFLSPVIGPLNAAPAAANPSKSQKPCPGDIAGGAAPGSGDGKVDVQDLVAVIDEWSRCYAQAASPSDDAAAPLMGECPPPVEAIRDVLMTWGSCTVSQQ